MIKLLSLIVEEIWTELFLLFGIWIPSKTSLALASALSGMSEVRRASLREQPLLRVNVYLYTDLTCHNMMVTRYSLIVIKLTDQFNLRIKCHASP